MDKNEIINTALKGIGMARVHGNTSEPIMPYLLADVMYQLYLADMNPKKLRHKMKQMHSMWSKKYMHFNKPIFSAFEPKDYTEITDLMDNVYEYLSNEITMLRSQIINVIGGIESFDDKKIVSTLIMCHIFAQYAECAYERVYCKTKKQYYGIIEEPSSNLDLCYLRDLSHKMAIQYIHDIPGGHLVLNEIDMQGMFNLIAKKIYQWLKEN